MNWLNALMGKNKRAALIKSLEETYYELKSKNPNKDEHWLLANTWLSRYGDWEVSKQKGPTWTRNAAYRDTFQFSILDAPHSIRGLALFLAYKELGDSQSKNDANELSRVMTDIQKLAEGGRLMDVYRQTNTLSWKEIESERDESIGGLYGFLKAAEHLNKNPEEMGRAMNDVKDLSATPLS